MKTIQIRRDHDLGLPMARRLGAQWASVAEDKLGLETEVDSTDDHDDIRFTRSGLSGHLRVAADHVEVVAKLGAMMTPLAGMIESQITEQLERMIARAADRGEA